MIELKNLSAGYHGGTVFHDVSLSFKQGEVLAILGPNGCGKSTLLRTVLGLHPQKSGQVLFDGVSSDQLTARQIAQKAAYLAQSRNVPNITARRMVLHGRFPQLSFPRRYRREDYDAVTKAMRDADAADIADRSVQELSGGQRQRVYLAMVLAQETDTVLMDEPTTYLDVQHQLEVMKIARHWAKQGKAVVLVLHDLCLAMRMADRVAILSDGKILQVGTPEEVYTSGILDAVFHIRVCRVHTENGWQYYYV